MFWSEKNRLKIRCFLAQLSFSMGQAVSPACMVTSHMQQDEKEDGEIHDEEPARRYFVVCPARSGIRWL
jgi:hypothetical protein